MEVRPEVPRRLAPQSMQEMAEVVAANEPVVLTGCLKQMSLWTTEMLEREMGDAKLPVRCFEEGGDMFRCSFFFLLSSFFLFLTSRRCRYRVVDMTLAEMKETLASEETTRHYLAGPNLLEHSDVRVRRVMGEARAEIARMVEEESIQEVGLWMGRDGQHTQMHFDVAHNLLHVIKGRKRVVLARPADFNNMYTYTSSDADESMLKRMYRFSRCDFRGGAELDFEAFPRLRRCELRVAVVNAGESLFIPLAHFHDVTSEGDTLGINVFWRPAHHEIAKYKWLKVFLDD